MWPEGTDLQALEAWTAKADKIASRSVGNAPCYHMLPFIPAENITLLGPRSVTFYRQLEF